MDIIFENEWEWDETTNEFFDMIENDVVLKKFLVYRKTEFEEIKKNGFNDISRNLIVRFKIIYYYSGNKDSIAYPEVYVTRKFEEPAKGPFDYNRIDFLYNNLILFYEDVVQGSIARHEEKDLGIDSPPGKNTGSIDFYIILLKVRYTIEPAEIPEYIKEEIAMLEEQIKTEKKELEELKDMIKERTIAIKNMENRLDKIKKTFNIE